MKYVSLVDSIHVEAMNRQYQGNVLPATFAHTIHV